MTFETVALSLTVAGIGAIGSKLKWKDFVLKSESPLLTTKHYVFYSASWKYNPDQEYTLVVKTVFYPCIYLLLCSLQLKMCNRWCHRINYVRCFCGCLIMVVYSLVSVVYSLVLLGVNLLVIQHFI